MHNFAEEISKSHFRRTDKHRKIRNT